MTLPGVSVSDILSHRTGLPANDLLWYGRSLNAEQLIAAVAKLDFVPGGFRRTFIYNNLLYGFLGASFEALIGEGWEACVTRRILKPLDMSSTCFAISEHQQNVALPYVGTRRVPRVDTSVIAAAGGIKSTLEDMTKWIRFHLNGGTTLEGERLRLLSDEIANCGQRQFGRRPEAGRQLARICRLRLEVLFETGSSDGPDNRELRLVEPVDLVLAPHGFEIAARLYWIAPQSRPAGNADNTVVKEPVAEGESEDISRSPWQRGFNV